MKILQVSSFFKPSWESGGVARVAYDISVGLSKKGHEVTVYTTNRSIYEYDLPINKFTEVDGLRVIYFENLRKYLSKILIPIIPYYLPIIIVKDIKNYDIIHIHEHRNLLSVLVSYYARKNGIPYVVQPHGSIKRIIDKIMIKYLLDLILFNKVIKNSSRVIAVSKSEISQILDEGIPEEKIDLVYNSIKKSIGSKESFQNKIKSEYNIKFDYKVILYLGRINKRKGIDFLLYSFIKLLEIKKDCVLIIVGSDDGYKNKLLDIIKQYNIINNVIFVGFLNNKYEAYYIADLLVYPSKKEIFGLVPFEAIMCDVPVIVTSDCGCGEIIQEAGIGLLVEYCDIVDLRDKMLFLLNNPESCDSMLVIGKEYIMNNLSIETQVERLINCYNKCIL